MSSSVERKRKTERARDGCLKAELRATSVRQLQLLLHSGDTVLTWHFINATSDLAG